MGKENFFFFFWWGGGGGEGGGGRGNGIWYFFKPICTIAYCNNNNNFPEFCINLEYNIIAVCFSLKITCIFFNMSHKKCVNCIKAKID